MKRLSVLTFYCILATNVDNLLAQSYSSVHYDTKDGLPSATVYDITQDRNGFIWFGTENGLCRFDGKNFKTFTTRNGLPDNSVLKVHADNSGRVYLTPFTHSLYYYQNDSFFKVPIPDKYKIDLSAIGSLRNKKDKIFIAANTDSYILDSNHLISFTDKFKMGGNMLGMIRIFDTLFILGSRDSIYFFPDSGKNQAYLRPDKGNNVFFDDSMQRRVLNIPKGLENAPSYYLPGNRLYLYFDNTFSIYNISTGNLIHKIKVEKFSNAFIDNENNLWIATLGNGVYRWPSFGFSHKSFDAKSEIFSLAKNKDLLFAGTDFSKMYHMPIHNVDSGYSISDFFKFADASGNPVSHFTRRNRIYVLLSDKNDLYIGADAFLLKKTGSSVPIFKKIYPVKDIDVTDNKIIVCTSYRVYLLDKQDMSVKDTLLSQRATCGTIYRGDYYIGTLGGLIKINSTTKAITQLFNLFPSFKGRITAIKRGMNDDLWIATSGSGLVRFKNDKIIATLKEEDGLTSDICTSLFVDGNLLWLGTNSGLNRIETGKEKPVITRLTSANGLGADFINTVLATDSNVYVGTAAGLTIFGKNIQAEKSVCILHILQVSESNRKLKKDSSYSFPHNALNIQIDFTAISFKSAGDISYYYRLTGLNQDWDTTAANFINFPTLQPGGYTLYLKAVNKFGVESETKTIRITILPPWWQTWLFRIAAFAALGLLVLIIYRYNIRSIRRKEEMKREFEARFSGLEQQALQAQMNPHFIFNSLNSIQTFILNLDVEGANAYLTNFANLIRQTLENSMQPLISVATELKYLETYLSLEKLRFRDKFTYTIDVDEAIEKNNTLLPGMLLQPYIENSIRHGIQHRKDNYGIISLTIGKGSGDSIIYTIMDNGVGRQKAGELRSSRHIEYQSRGTSINEKRIVAINKQFKIDIRVNTEDVLDENGTVAGTRVTVIIPRLHN